MADYNCICGKSFDNNKSLASHKATCNVYKNSDESNLYKNLIIKNCIICNKAFKTRVKSRTTCSQKCGSKAGFITKKNNGLFRKVIKSNCKICNKEIEYFEGSTLHSETCSSSCANRLRWFKFRNIEPTKENLKIYFELKEKEVNKIKKPKQERKYFTNKCVICGKEFIRPDNEYQRKIKTCCSSCSHKYQAQVRKQNGNKLGFANKENFERIKEENMKKYGVPYFCMTDKCKKQNGSFSKVNKKFAQLFKENDILVEQEFNIGNKSYDFHVLNTNILIEVNPTYTHNSDLGPYINGKRVKAKSKQYHYDKTKYALDHNYKCLHIFDWTDKYEIFNLINENNFDIKEKDNYDVYKCNLKGTKCFKEKEFSSIQNIKNKENYVSVYDDKHIIIKKGEI